MKHRQSKRSPSNLHHTARKMGRKIADLGGSGDAVTEADLLTDFSAADIAAHAEAARGYARELLGEKRPASVNVKPSIAKLPGVRLVLTDEPAVGEALPESLVKDVIGGEPIQIRKLTTDPFKFPTDASSKLAKVEKNEHETWDEKRFSCDPVIVTNNPPVVAGNVIGIWRPVEPSQAVEEWKG
ncbi:hypothetical protein [Azospirillum endophyticum]